MRRQEIAGITGARGLAAISVVLFHFGSELAEILPSFAHLEPVWKQGYLGVDLFFMVSGFVLAYVYADQAVLGVFSFREFCLRRFARIYPNYAASLLALLALVLAAGLVDRQIDGEYSELEFVSQALVVHALPIPGVYSRAAAWNYPSWSVSAEVFAYVALFPLLLWLFTRRYRPIRFGPWLSSALMAVGGLIAFYGWLGVWHSILRITIEFTAGYILFLSWGRSATTLRAPMLTMPLVAFSALVLPFTLTNAVVPVVLAGLMPVLILALAEQRRPVTKLMSRKPVVFLGKISYAIYLWHAIVEKVLKVALPAEGFGDSSLVARASVAAVYLVAPIVVGAVTYICWEQPANKYLIRRHAVVGDRKRRDTQPPANPHH